MGIEVLAIGFDAAGEREQLGAAAGERFRLTFESRPAAVVRRRRDEMPRLCLVNGSREGPGDAAAEIRRWCRHAPGVPQIVVVHPRRGAARVARTAAELEQPVYCVASAEEIVELVAAALGEAERLVAARGPEDARG